MGQNCGGHLCSLLTFLPSEILLPPGSPVNWGGVECCVWWVVGMIGVSREPFPTETERGHMLRPLGAVTSTQGGSW